MMKPAQSDIDHCMATVRDYDMDRYLSVLFAPREIRANLFALYAFNLEIAGARKLVSEPLVGELRLQWWQDTIDALYHGETPDHPVARLLRFAIDEAELREAPFSEMIETRRFDLYNDGAPDLAFLENYAEVTSSTLLAMAVGLLAGDQAKGATDTIRHGGIAYALTGLMSAFAFHCGRGQVYLPRDLLAENDLTPEAVLVDPSGAAVLKTLGRLRDIARTHLKEARRQVHGLPEAAHSAFLPLTLVERRLDLMDAPGFDPYHDQSDVTGLARYWLYWRAAWRGKF